MIPLMTLARPNNAVGISIMVEQYSNSVVILLEASPTECTVQVTLGYIRFQETLDCGLAPEI
jgi:hypothetical protein